MWNLRKHTQTCAAWIFINFSKKVDSQNVHSCNEQFPIFDSNTYSFQSTFNQWSLTCFITYCRLFVYSAVGIKKIAIAGNCFRSFRNFKVKFESRSRRIFKFGEKSTLLFHKSQPATVSSRIWSTVTGRFCRAAVSAWFACATTARWCAPRKNVRHWRSDAEGSTPKRRVAGKLSVVWDILHDFFLFFLKIPLWQKNIVFSHIF